MNRLRSVLPEFHPQALIAFPNLRRKAALPVLSAASTPALGQSLTRRKVVALLHGCGRRSDPALVEQILRDLHTENLRQPAPVELALGQAVLALFALLHTRWIAVPSPAPPRSPALFARLRRAALWWSPIRRRRS